MINFGPFMTFANCLCLGVRCLLRFRCGIVLTFAMFAVLILEHVHSDNE